MALIPVTIADTDDAPVGFRGLTAAGKCATCTRCGHSAAAPLCEDRKPARVVRDALNALARSCPTRSALHAYYPDRLPAGVRLEYLYRGRRLPCHLVGKELVGAAGSIAKAAPVFAVCESKDVAEGWAVDALVRQLGPKRREAVPARMAEPGLGRKARRGRPARTIPGWTVVVEVEHAAGVA